MARRRTRRPGRPSRIREQSTVGTLLDGLSKGLTVEAACQHVGIHPATLYHWVARGEEAAARRDEAEEPVPATERPFVEFYEAITRVRAERQVRCLEVVDKVAQGGYVVAESETYAPDGSRTVERKYAAPEWRAAAWELERAYPQQWGRQAETHRVELTGAGGGPVAVEGSTQVSALAARLREVAAQRDEALPGVVEGEVVEGREAS